MFWSSLLEGSEVLELFLIALDITQLLTAFSASLPTRYTGLYGYGLWDAHLRLIWLQRLLSWSQDRHLPKSLRNKMRRKENTSLGCWWFLEENLICNLWFGLQLSVCVDFTAVEMKHLVTLAGAGPALGRCSTGKFHISSVQTPPLLPNPLNGIAGRDLWATTQLVNTKDKIRW